MKMRGKKVIAAWMVLLLFGLAACGSQNGESTMPNDVEEQSSVSEQPTESPSENPADDSTEAGAESSDGEEGSKPFREMTVAEKIKTLSVEGCSLSIPCQVKDMGEGLSLGEGLTLSGDTTCELMYEGRWLGSTLFRGLTLETLDFEDMSTGYEDVWIYNFNGGMNVNFEIAGVTPDLTLDDVIELWGEPDIKSEEHLEYYDINEETGKTEATIVLYLFKGDDLMIIYVGLFNR